MLSQRPPIARYLAVLSCGLLYTLPLAPPIGAQETTEDPNRTCYMCHGDPENFGSREDGQRLIVTEDEFAGSVHGGFGFACTTCHRDFAFPHPEEYVPVRCGACHGSEDRQYGESVHGYALARDNERAPTCAGCHGKHDIRRSDDPDSHTYHTRVAETCTDCHSTAGLLTDQYLKLPSPGAQFAQSVHGEAGEAGDMGAATCTDCHGVHDLRGHNDPFSAHQSVERLADCGACHQEITTDYDRSIHGRRSQPATGTARHAPIATASTTSCTRPTPTPESDAAHGAGPVRRLPRRS